MGRLEVRVSADDVGKRVSIRRLAEAGEPGGRFTDTVGILTSWNDGVVVVTRRTGEQVRMAEASLVAGKVVPEVPARRRGPAASYEELARVGARAWQPVESEQLGDWLLRAAAQDGPDEVPEVPVPEVPENVAENARQNVPEQRDAGEERTGVAGAVAAGAGAHGADRGRTDAAGSAPRRTGFTRRANSVLPLGDPGMPLPEALARVRAWYARRGLPAYIQTATGAKGSQEQLCAELEAHGWRREVTAELRTAPLAPLADPPGRHAAGADRVHLSRDMDEGWLRRYHRAGGAGGRDGGIARAVLTAGPSVWFASVPDQAPVADEAPVAGGAPVLPAAIGRCVVDGRWAGFMAVEVAPAARRRGLATAVMAALARRALDEGASAAWLQVERDNVAARALYDGMGFAVHHSYHHYRR